MDIGGLLMLVGHASAASNEWWWRVPWFSCSFVQWMSVAC
jgi:hypothetical protein